MAIDASKVTRRGFIAGTAAGMAACAATAGIAAAEEPAGEEIVATGSAMGRRGQIMVKVRLAGTTIEAVEVIKQHETPMIANSAISRILELIIQNQSLDLDAVTGATITSYGIIGAVRDALAQAGVSEDDLAHSGTENGIRVEEPLPADIAVIGGGLTGMVAAVRALQNGNTVALFEESAHLGGSSCVSDGWVTGADTIMERAEGTQDSVEAFYGFLSHNSDDPAVVPYPDTTMRFAEMSGPVLDWLDSYVNVDFGERKGGYGLYVAPDQPRIFGVNNGGDGLALALIEFIQDAIREGRASVILEARVTKLLKDEAGAISGIEVTYGEGTVKEFPFRAVILGTGGYSHNQEMMPYANCGSLLALHGLGPWLAARRGRRCPDARPRHLRPVRCRHPQHGL